MYPADLLIPMVAPLDLGEIAAQRLVSTLDDIGIRYVGGPRRYSSADVAKAFSQVLGAPVGVDVIPRDEWKEAFQGLGFSEAAADSYARMTAVSLDGGFDMPDDALRGATTLEAHIRDLLSKAER